MIGPEGVAKHAATYIADTMPGRLALIAERTATPPVAPPQLVADQDRGPIPIEDWPVVYVLPGATRDFTLVDVLPDAGQVYRVTYSVEFVAWVRGTTYEETDTIRKRYALALREALLVRTQLDSAAVPAPSEFVIAPSTIRESFSPVFTDEGRTLAGCTLTVDVIVAEALVTTPTTGTVIDTAPTVDASLPRHPAL